jgi:hypothetical protein
MVFNFFDKYLNKLFYFFKVFSLTIVFCFVVFLSGCSFFDSDEDVDDLSSYYGMYPNIEPLIVEMCISGNAIPFKFDSPCANTCDYLRGSITVCGSISVESCKCGENMCWNTQSRVCEII